jgi:hypothetical protein
VPRREWSVEFHPACGEWADELDQRDSEALLAAVRRPGSTGRTEVRVLFAFDLERKAILLVGGDKSDDWNAWYDINIPIADRRFSEHQAKLATKRKTTPPVRKAGTQEPRRGRRR